jgi:hypothetical protein
MPPETLTAQTNVLLRIVSGELAIGTIGLEIVTVMNE